jgi:HAE1 family hydrophobic/amphiphilic exporter-1
MQKLENLVLTIPETKSIFSTLGKGARKEVNKGTLLVALKDRSERKRSQQQIMAELRDKVRDIPGFKAYVENFEPISFGGRRNAPLQLDIKGLEIKELEKISNQIMREMVKRPGIVDVSSDL